LPTGGTDGPKVKTSADDGPVVLFELAIQFRYDISTKSEELPAYSGIRPVFPGCEPGNLITTDLPDGASNISDFQNRRKASRWERFAKAAAAHWQAFTVSQMEAALGLGSARLHH
jgi:hypothetical protein